MGSTQTTPLPVPKPIFFHTSADASVVMAMRALFRRRPRERRVTDERRVILSATIESDRRRVLGIARPHDDTVLLLVPRWRKDPPPRARRSRARDVLTVAFFVLGAGLFAASSPQVRSQAQHAWTAATSAAR